MIRLSIIIPHYNSVEFLAKLLYSIPEREEIQVLVVDDNSTEGKREFDRLTGERSNVSAYRNLSGKNSAGICRNIALDHAKGEWLLFADADDYFLDGFYEVVSEYLDSEFDIVYFSPTSLDLRNGQVSNRHESFAGLVRDYREKRDKVSECRLRYYQEGPVSKMIRRRLVTQGQIRFDNTRVANDVMFSIKCACAAGKIEADDREIYCITKTGGSLTMDQREENFYTRLSVFVEKYRFLRERLSGEEWKMTDLLGEHYIKLAKAYGLGRRGIWKVYLTFLKNRIRPCISRKWTLSYLLGKAVKGKV